MTPWLALVLQAVLVVLAAPTLAGVLLGSPAAPWRRLVRLSRKPRQPPPNASFLYAVGAPLSLGAAAAAALLVPTFSLDMATLPASDLVVVAGLLALSRMAPALAAFDTGAAQAAIGAQLARARLPAEPILLLAALCAVLTTGSTNLAAAALHDAPGATRLPLLLAALALLAVIAIEPPSPGVFSGRALALVTAAGQLRLVAGLSAVAAIGLPVGIAPPGAEAEAWVVGLAFWTLKLVGLGALATLLAPHRIVGAAAALLALIAAVLLGALAAA